jgi:superfamily II DNA or RNA helicase
VLSLAQLPEPRLWQKAALEAWTAAGRRGIAKVATGGGKTSFALLALSACEDLERLLVLVPTVALADQWYLALEAAGAPRAQIKVWPSRSTSPAKYNVMVANTARTRAPILFGDLPGTGLVVDECHRFGSAENARALDVRCEVSIGLSATPERQFDQGLEEYVIPAVGEIIYTYGLEQALRDRVLTKFQLANVRIALTAEEQGRYDSLTRRIARAGHDDSESEQVERLLRARARVSKNAARRVPAALAIMEAHRGRRALVFHEEIRPVEALSHALQQRGHSVGLYHSLMSSGLRRDNLRQFQIGALDVLLTCRALDEGLDVPGAELAVIVAATSSSRQRIQRIGRVLRSSADKELATVITIYATDLEERRLLEESTMLHDQVPVTWQEAR